MFKSICLKILTHNMQRHMKPTLKPTPHTCANGGFGRSSKSGNSKCKEIMIKELLIGIVLILSLIFSNVVNGQTVLTADLPSRLELVYFKQ